MILASPRWPTRRRSRSPPRRARPTGPAPSEREGGPQPGSKPRGDEKGLAKEVESWQGRGMDGLRACLDGKRVQFGVIRFVIGSGNFSRSKFCFVHVVGESVPVVKRGKHNSRKEEIMAAMQGSHTDLSFTSAAEVTTEAILTHMLSIITADEGEGELDVGAARKQMEVR